MKKWIKEFDKKFTRKSLELEDKGQYRDDWFIKDTITSKEIKDFIRSLLLSQHDVFKSHRENPQSL